MTPQAWLDGERDYDTGRQLYEQLGDNARLKRHLAGGPSAYNREALAWELGKLARGFTVTSDVLVNVTEEVTKESRKDTGLDTGQNPESSANATISLHNVPKEVRKEPGSDESGTELSTTASVLLVELRQARRPLYDERTVLHQALEHHPTEADCLAAARRILHLSRELNANWKNDAHVREHGELPAGPAPAPGLETLTPAELLRKRNNLRSQVSKLKNQPHRADDLAAVEATLSQVEVLLNPTA